MINLPLGNCALIVSKKEPTKFLAVCRPDNSQMLCFPGGKLEKGETSLEGMKREVYEETGLKIDPINAIPIYSGVCKGTIDYWVTTYLIQIQGDETLDPPEKNMFPTWVEKEYFIERSSFVEFNKSVFESVKDFFDK